MYNTLEDIVEGFGMPNVSRYFNLVTPEIEKAYLDQKQQEAAQAAQANQPVDPGMALIQAEQIKGGTEKFKVVAQARAKALELQLQAIQANATDDLERDKMAQKLDTDYADIMGRTGVAIDKNDVAREQAKARTPLAGVPSASPTSGASAA
jgi:hypothetical protein